MTEGEFKKRLFTCTSFSMPFELSEEENAKISEIQAQMVRCSNTIRDKVLEEAKKEFPIDLNWEPETTIPEINRILNFKRRGWFEKWFGGVDEK